MEMQVDERYWPFLRGRIQLRKNKRKKNNRDDDKESRVIRYNRKRRTKTRFDKHYWDDDSYEQQNEKYWISECYY